MLGVSSGEKTEARLYSGLKKQEKYYLAAVSLCFAVIPTRIFLGISGDVIQISVMIVPVAVAFMAIMLSIDITFGLPIPSDATERLSDRRKLFSDNLTYLLHYGLTLVVLTLAAKSFALWSADSTWMFAAIINHFTAWAVGYMATLVMIKVRNIRDIFGYLSVGADIAQRVRFHKDANSSSDRINN